MHDHVKRISIYVQMSITNTRITIPKVIHVVLLLFLETVDKCFFDERVAVRLSRHQSAIACSDQIQDVSVENI